MAARTQPARYWLATLKVTDEWTPNANVINDTIQYIKGQREIGAGGYEHYQLFIYTKKSRLTKIKSFFPNHIHLEQSRSEAAEAYVWKEDTRVEGSQFEYGKKPFKRNCKEDWDQIRELAQKGDITNPIIPSDVYVRHYSALRNIAKDHARPEPRIVPTVHVYWGVTGSGKSHRAFTEATDQNEPFYRKSPSTKWWDGYRGERKVVIDEFSGLIGITHLLQWLDKWPCSVEIKGSNIPLCATEFWITSNKSPDEWYQGDTGASFEQIRALHRRLTHVVHFTEQYNPAPNEPLDAPPEVNNVRYYADVYGEILNLL